MDKLSVVLVAILGALLLGEKLTVINWLGVGLIAGLLIAIPRISPLAAGLVGLALLARRMEPR